MRHGCSRIRSSSRFASLPFLLTLLVPSAGSLGGPEDALSGCWIAVKKLTDPELAKSFDKTCLFVRRTYADAARLRVRAQEATKRLGTEDLTRMYDKLCNASLATAVLGAVPYAALKENPELNKTWIGQHFSNYVQGTTLMAAFHTCLSKKNPTRSSQYLASSLGLNLAGNAYFELGATNEFDLFETKSTYQSPRTSTDVGDLSAGVYATATYLALIKAIEQAYALRLSKECGVP